MRCSVMALRLNTPVKSPAPAPLATCMCVRDWIRLEEATDEEDDYLDKAWGLDMDSRLSCQAIVGEEALTIEIPRYTINMVSENH